MINEDILNFSEFLDYFKNSYGKPSWEISLPSPKDEDYNDDEKQKPLVSSDYIILDFDSMCEDANFYPKENLEECNQPSTVDGLYYRIIDENKLELFLFEFKSFDFGWDKDKDYRASLNKVKSRLIDCGLTKKSQQGLNRLEKIKSSYGNTVEFSLRLKPYESLFVVLPKLYDEYCEEKNICELDKINIYNFFKSDLCEIKLVVVGKKYGDDPNRAHARKLGSLLDKQYRRLDFVNVLTYHSQRLCFESEFDFYTNHLRLHECDNLKSLNYDGV